MFQIVACLDYSFCFVFVLQIRWLSFRLNSAKAGRIWPNSLNLAGLGQDSVQIVELWQSYLFAGSGQTCWFLQYLAKSLSKLLSYGSLTCLTEFLPCDCSSNSADSCNYACKCFHPLTLVIVSSNTSTPVLTYSQKPSYCLYISPCFLLFCSYM